MRKPKSVLEIGTWFHFWIRGSKSKAEKLVSCFRLKGLGTEELSHDLQKKSSECDTQQSSDVIRLASSVDRSYDSGLYKLIKDLFSIFLTILTNDWPSKSVCVEGKLKIEFWHFKVWNSNLPPTETVYLEIIIQHLIVKQ